MPADVAAVDDELSHLLMQSLMTLSNTGISRGRFLCSIVVATAAPAYLIPQNRSKRVCMACQGTVSPSREMSFGTAASASSTGFLFFQTLRILSAVSKREFMATESSMSSIDQVLSCGTATPS